MGTCHLIPFLVLLLTTCYSFSYASRRLLDDQVGCTYSSDDDVCSSRTATGGGGPPGFPGQNVCFPCPGNSLGGLVIGLPGISIPGLGIGLPTISIGTHGIQVGGYGGMSGYIPGLGYPLCCLPAAGYGQVVLPSDPGPVQGGCPQTGSPHTPPSPPWNAHGNMFESEMKWKQSEGYNKGMVKPNMEMGKQGSVWENVIQRQENTEGNNDEGMVKPNMEIGKHESVLENAVQRQESKDDQMVKPNMEMGKGSQSHNMHKVKPTMETEKQGNTGDNQMKNDKKAKMHLGRVENHGDVIDEEYKEVYAMPPVSY